MTRYINNRSGMALVLVLVIMTILVAMVTEFAYSVHVNTSLLENWQAMQQLSTATSSGAAVAAELIRQKTSGKSYTYPGSVIIPPMDPFGQGVTVSLRIEDESGKFNVNTLVYENGTVNEESFARLERLLEVLEIDKALAQRIADWVDSDELPRTADSEDGYRNAKAKSIRELSGIHGMGGGVYDKLIPYITVYGGGQVNINAAPQEVLMALSPQIDEEMALTVMKRRDEEPFDSAGALTDVAGFESLGISIVGAITVKGTEFMVTSTAINAQDGFTRVLNVVLDSSGKALYWREN